MTPERLAIEMGLDIPDFDLTGYYGADYGTMKPFHRVGSLLFLSGHVAQIGAEITHKGRLGETLTTDQGYQAARRTGLNVLGGIRQAVGSLDRVKGIVRSLNFVVCTPEFEEVHKVSSGLSDLFVEVFGEARGRGARSAVGMAALPSIFADAGADRPRYVPTAIADRITGLAAVNAATEAATPKP